MTVTGQKKISIYDLATGTVVQLNNISEEGEFEKKSSFIKTSAGNRMYAGDESKCEFLSLDWTGYDQLVLWMKNRTLVRFVTYGLDEHILWYEDTYITVDQKTVFSPYKRSGFKIYFEKAGGVHNIYKGANLLFTINGWADKNSNNMADGYSINGSSNPTCQFTNDLQLITTNANGILQMITSSFVYPISLAKLFLSVKVESSTISNALLDVVAYSFNAAVLQEFAANITNVLSITTPVSIYSMQIYVVLAASVSSGQSIQLKRPLLSTVNSYSETNY